MKEELLKATPKADTLTNLVIGAAFKVHNTLGYGFLESIYEKSLLIELKKIGLTPTFQSPINVFYEDQNVGKFYADLQFENELIIELKSVSQLNTKHEVQLVNYLNATKIDHGLLLNFGPDKVDIKRKFRILKNN